MLKYFKHEINNFNEFYHYFMVRVHIGVYDRFLVGFPVGVIVGVVGYVYL